MKKEDKISVILGTHAHVPAGADESEFESVYKKKVLPFITSLYKNPKVQAVLHYSGVLFQWIERTHPEFFMLIEDIVSRKQAEILSGGFYDPVFPIIPPQDRIGQIELLTTFIRKHFGKRPLGCWIPHMAWEQHMSSFLSSSDMQYTFLSQNQFFQAGITDENIYIPYITEDQGKNIVVFPVFMSVENELAEKKFSDVFIDIKKKFDEEQKTIKNKIISIFPDKIFSSVNEAPNTAWNRFFEEISLSDNIVETVLPGKIIKNNKKYQKICFQDSSSLCGYMPRRFIIEHCEAGGIYSKMIFTNVLINQLKGDKSRKENAREELWKSQDSILFTPGIGQVDNKLRKSAYSSILRAEKISTDKLKNITSVIQYDFDFDAMPEYLIQNEIINCYIQLKGAGIYELDYMPKEWNYLDCGSINTHDKEFCRKRKAFSDVILPSQVKIEEIEKKYPRYSRFLTNEYFESFQQDKKGKVFFKLPASGSEAFFGNIEVIKCYMLKKNTINVSYNLKNTGKEKYDFCFLPEIFFSFADTGEKNVRFLITDSSGNDTQIEKQITNTGNLKILDVKNEVQIMLASVNQFSGCIIPVIKEGYYQSSRIMPLFSVSLESGKTWTNDFSLKFTH
ncbi:MAG: DUF1926 domain-containing protein [Treponema sp.]|nr:DUF1926 domain-containing protein [Treponema sp.]